MNSEEIAEFIEAELEKFNNLHALVRFLDSSIFFLRNQCQLVLCSNCAFINKFADELYKYFHNEENILNNMKNLCRENSGNFLSLVALLKCLASLNEEDRDLILYIWNMNIGITP